ncbi:MAG TPA: hypothetical protein DCP91_08210 [Eggerthellaceae bacterium]|nr:hypothetical protein [Eggerthellaceae bacterium]
MNNELFQQAKVASIALDYNRALELYAQCLQDTDNPPEPGEVGLIYHQLGNCLVKLKSYYEAIEAYGRATNDSAYDAVGTVNCNMGMAYAALRDWANAVKHFEIAVSDRNYPTPYKAFTGMGNALMKQGKSAEAGVAFREAALDEANPDPTKALLNLGVCFMALNRPADAVASYESALQFDMSTDTRNKMYASLGQAYVASGQMQQAVDAFENAIADKTYFLSDSASVDYQRAVAAVAQGTAEATQALPAIADTSGLDVITDEPTITPTPSLPPQDPYVVDERAVSEEYYFADQFAKQGDYAPKGEERFFNATDEELEQWSKGVVKMERKRRSTGLKVLLAIVLVVLVALGACLFLYTQGFGWPTQEAVVEQVFADPTAESNYVQGTSEEDIEKMSSLIPKDSTAHIDGMNKSINSSTVYVTAETPEGGEMMYEVSMLRDMLSWKVSGIGLYYPSQQ